MVDVEGLRIDLKSSDLATRTSAAEQFSQMGSAATAAAAELVQTCGDDETASQFAVAALEEMGPPPVDSREHLSALLSSPQSLVGYWAATLIGRLKIAAKDCQDNLASVLVSSSNPAVRERAAWALGEIRADSEAAIQALTKASQSSNARLQRLAAASLEQLRA